MREKATSIRSFEKKAATFLTSFTVLLLIAIFFGYAVGKDLALRDNAQDAAAQTAK